jgi:sterol 3beta-glucosyltransferase
MMDYVFSIAGDVARTAFAACDDADLIVHSFLFTTGGHSWARAHGIPDVSVQAFPMFAPTRAFPNVAIPNIPSGGLSYFSHWFATQVFWHFGNLGYWQLRGTAPDIFNLKLYWPFDGRQPIQTPLLFAYSPTVIPHPSDWTAPHLHTTGYLFLDAAEAYAPPQALMDFLAAGDAPVCITFGSMINQEAERIHAAVRAALKQTRQRGIILTGWGGRKPDEHDDDLLYLDAAPHDWLFPRCKTVIHHGGAGTTAAGLRAGIPNIVVPHGVDQPFWGKRVAAIGAGPTPIDLKKLSAAALTAAFAQAESPALRARAQAVGRLIRSEDGVGRAVQIIESHVAQFVKLRHDTTV